jgi:hypothetical protein
VIGGRAVIIDAIAVVGVALDIPGGSGLAVTKPSAATP